jgi:hypothetical protein
VSQLIQVANGESGSESWNKSALFHLVNIGMQEQNVCNLIQHVFMYWHSKESSEKYSIIQPNIIPQIVIANEIIVSLQNYGSSLVKTTHCRDGRGNCTNIAREGRCYQGNDLMAQIKNFHGRLQIQVGSSRPVNLNHSATCAIFAALILSIRCYRGASAHAPEM